MFHFPSLAPMMAIHSPPGHRHTDGQVTPFGHPRINAQLPTPRGLTQTHTSFIGLPCPRHPPCAQKNTHKKHSTKKKNARVHFPVLTHHNHNHHKHPTNEAPTTAEASHTTPQQCHARHPTACQHTPQPTPRHPQTGQRAPQPKCRSCTHAPYSSRHHTPHTNKEGRACIHPDNFQKNKNSLERR